MESGPGMAEAHAGSDQQLNEKQAISSIAKKKALADTRQPPKPLITHPSEILNGSLLSQSIYRSVKRAVKREVPWKSWASCGQGLYSTGTIDGIKLGFEADKECGFFFTQGEHPAPVFQPHVTFSKFAPRSADSISNTFELCGSKVETETSCLAKCGGCLSTG